MAEIITILSGKGGTGKTLFAVNMGAYLSLQGKRVLIMDLNFSSRGVDIALGLEGRVIYDIVDVLKGECRIKQALVKSREYPNLYILEPPAVKKNSEVSILELAVLAERAGKDFDYVIIDTSGGINSVTEGFGAKADKTMLITTQDPISVRAGQSLLAALKSRDAKNVSLLINKVKLRLTDNGYLTDIDDIAEGFGLDVCGVMPYDEAMHVAYNNGRASVDLEESEGAEHLKRVIQRFVIL